MNNKTTPLVSVVFTSYNHKEYLKQALDSIVNQSYHNIEVLVVDDCSTDGSQDILIQYNNNPKVKLHLLNNNTGSYVKASNYGAQFAKGEYLIFAQCDDFADLQQIEILVNKLIENPQVGVAYSRSNMVDQYGIVYSNDFLKREKEFRKKCSQSTIITGPEMGRFLSYSCVIPNLSASLIKRGLYTKVGMLSDKYLVAADWAFWLALSELTDFYYITRPLNNFRQHETTIRSKIKLQKQIIEIYALFYEHIKNHNLSSKRILEIKKGAGAIWFAYILAGLKSKRNIFFPIIKETFKYEKLNIFFLIIGALKYIHEYFHAKLDLQKTI